MKIAFVGKGGSGKSSTSWLIIKTLEANKTPTLAIDADHNMDLTSNLGTDPELTPRMEKSDKEFMSNAIKTCCSSRKETHTHTPRFSVTPLDSYTDSITVKLSPYLSLINMGLGSPEVLFQSSCAHGLSGPLKYYLGFLDEHDAFVVIDSVAGADMLNYGLYAGIDAVIGVVEPHRNSVKVFEQIKTICSKTMIPCYAVVNKPDGNDFYNNFIEKNSTIILGEIPFDPGILNYEFETLQEKTLEASQAIIKKIQNLKKQKNLSSYV